MPLNRRTAMLTHAYPKLLFRGPEFNARSALRTAAARWREATCGIGGHEYYVHSTSNRIFMRCSACGRETPGWRIDARTRPGTIAGRAQKSLPGLEDKSCGRPIVTCQSSR